MKILTSVGVAILGKVGTLVAVACLATSISSSGCDSAPDADVCNTVTNIASTVGIAVEPGPVPTMTGGTIVDGTYVLASFTRYAGVGSRPSVAYKQTIVIAGNTYQNVTSGNGGPDEHSTITLVPSGTPEFNGTSTCGGGLPAVGSYTATPTTFAFRPLKESGQEDYLLTYSKQEGRNGP